MAPAPGQATGGPVDPCLGLGDGTYCGGDGIGGDTGTLYVCQGGATGTRTVCAGGCQFNPPGTPDACKPAPPGVGSGGGELPADGDGSLGPNMSSGQDEGTMPGTGCSYTGSAGPPGTHAAWLLPGLLLFVLRRRRRD
jgi:MYXO-CTERM domain-containing protein